MAFGLGKVASKMGKGASNIGKAMTGKPSGKPSSGINTGPSKGFGGRMMQQMPAMVNSMATQFGDPSMRGATQRAGSAFPMMRPQAPPPQGMPSPIPEIPGGMPNIVAGPSQMPPSPGGMFKPGQNTGIVGPQPMSPMGGSPMGGNPGLMNMYNQMLQQRRPVSMM